MTLTDIIVLFVIALVVGGASFYIIRAKRRGQRCIGCPDSKTCGGNCSACQGCSHQQEETK